MPDSSFEFMISHPSVQTLTGWIDEPRTAERNSAILLAHGAGAAPDSPFLEAVATGLAALGFRVMRFAYPYMQRRLSDGGRRPPDRTPLLEHAHRAALEALRSRTASANGERRIVLAGKSLGGRMSSHLAAQGEDCAGLIFLGYPLHPAKRPDKLRSEHFPMICQPSLFLQGTRDPLCDLDLLEQALARYGGQPTLQRIEGADHGFAVLKRSGRTGEDVLAELLSAIDHWERRSFPA